MPAIVSSIITIAVPIIIIACIIFIIGSGYVKSPPDQAYIISGPWKKNRILIGRASVKLPFFERLDRLNLSLIPIDVKTSSEVPTADYINIKVDAAVNIKINTEPAQLDRAAVNFLNLPTEQIGKIAREVLEGNMREIIGQMHLEEMVSDRQKFATLVKENAAPDLAEMGLEIISFNVQNFEDRNGVIENLGVDNVVRIQKAAAISRAESERDIAIKKSESAQQANDAKVAAAAQIAERNAELERKQAALKKDVDTQAAQAEAAKNIEAENQRKLREVAATNANIAKAEREAELRQKEIELKEYELDAKIRKQADADKYAAEQRAAAELIRRQKEAEAAAYEIAQQAEAEKARADAEKYTVQQQAEAQKARAEADKFSAEQKAAGIAAIGEAEAQAIEKKALAQEKMGKASVLDMYFQALPQIVANAATPLNKVDKITMFGEGNSTKLVADVMKTANQILEGVKEATGIDLSTVLTSFTNKESNDNA